MSTWISKNRRAAMAGCALTVLTFAAQAQAQDAPAAEATVDEVVVTGSLVVRNGNAAPTPVTVVDTASLQQSAPSNIPDGLNQLPQFSGSRSQAQNSQSLTAVSPAAGNYLNLRNLGIQRSLILLDGQRVPPTSFEGVVDVNVLPQALIQRVDVVTAGASATYGSDAVTGVVNFVLDKKFKGVKGVVQGGVSEYGDNNSYRFSVAGGAPVLDGRGHLLFSLEHFQSDGIKDKADRPLYDAQPIAYGNGTSVPYRIEYNARQNNATYGGMVQTGPFANQFFNPDGSLSPYSAGSLPVFNGVQIGGSGSLALNHTLVGYLRTEQAFARASYDITDTVSAFAQLTFGESRNRYAHNGSDNRLGTLTIFSGNAFLTPAQQAQLTATNTASFRLGRQGHEQGRKVVDILNDSLSIMAGLEGKVLGDWDWRLTYAGGGSLMRAKHTRNPQNARYFAALDAVRDAGGNIVCRVTITNPGLYPGCVPMNLLGANRASQASLDYVFGADSQYDVRNDLHDFAGTLSGSLFELPAGPVNAAFGAEFRTQSLEMRSNADPAIPLDLTGLRGVPAGSAKFGNTNQGVADGEQDVKEVFGEILAPLLKDVALAESLDLNAAARVTDYSTSGQVETWKLGFSYTPVSDLRVRGTISRDIRAPTLSELFSGVQSNSSAFTDIHTNTTLTIATLRSGNADLTPEIGKTKTIGLVFQPGWLTGFTAAVDYYDIDIEDAIASRTIQQLNQDCEDSGGASPACALIIRPNPFSDRSAANAPTRILIQPVNLSRAYTHGLDIDVGYRFALSNLWEGSDAQLTLRALANYAPSYKTMETPTSAIQQQAGLGGNQNTPTGNPVWRVTSSVNYENGPLSMTLQQRYIGDMVRSLTPNIVYADGDIPSVTYYNLTAAYRFEVAEHRLEAFLNINNLFDKDPPLVPYTTEPGLRYPTLQTIYDVVGRYYTAGVRFSF